MWVQEPWGRALRCRRIPAPHLFTSRDLELRENGSEWEAVAASLAVSRERLLLIRQVHGTAVAVVRRSEAPGSNSRPEADIIISNDPSVAIGVRVADCVPVLAFDTRTGAAGAAHAGWRGTAARAAERLVTAMGEAYGTKPDDLICAIGPSLGPCCGEVGDEVRIQFRAGGADEASLARWFRPGTDGKSQIDLWRANRDQLERAGVGDGRIHSAELCTKTHAERFHSYRAARERAGRMLAAIKSS